ncbi:hypothetical protein FBU30_001579 [Linnemannia zychae]|nr:hypothetical protein FBU30_001579 [Linnemannia zychae]
MSETSNASRKRSNTTADLDELNPGVQDMLNAPLGEEDEFGNGNQESGEETEDEDREVYTQDIASGEEDRGGSDRDAVGRKQNFRKFSLPSHEIILLEALDAVRPFGAQHGQTQAAWLRVVHHEAKMKRVTGAQLEVSKRLELMQMIYEYEQECIARAKEIREFKR